MSTRQRPPGDPEAVRRAFAELGEVLAGIVETAERVSTFCCPYMDARRRCTASFPCINQVSKPGFEKPLCSGQHKINFSPVRGPQSGA